MTPSSISARPVWRPTLALTTGHPSGHREPPAVGGSHTEVLRALLELARTALRVPMAFVSTVFEDRERIRSQAGSLRTVQIGASAPLGRSLLGHVLTSRRATAIADTRAHPLTADSEWIRCLGAAAVLCTPFEGADGSQAGMLTLCAARARQWTEEEIALAERVASLGRLAMEIARCSPDRRSEVDPAEHAGVVEEKMALLVAALANAATAPMEESLIDAAARLVAPAVADWCAVYGQSAVQPSRHPALRFTYPYAMADLEAALPLASEIAQARLGVKRAFEMGTPQQTSDAVFFADDDWTAPVGLAVRAMRPHALLALPLSLGSSAWGVILAARTRKRGCFSHADVLLASGIGEATAIGLARFGA